MLCTSSSYIIFFPFFSPIFLHNYEKRDGSKTEQTGKKKTRTKGNWKKKYEKQTDKVREMTQCKCLR